MSEALLKILNAQGAEYKNPSRVYIISAISIDRSFPRASQILSGGVTITLMDARTLPRILLGQTDSL